MAFVVYMILRIGSLAKTDLLVPDVLSAARLTEEHRRDLLEVLDDRYDARTTPVHVTPEQVTGLGRIRCPVSPESAQ